MCLCASVVVEFWIMERVCRQTKLYCYSYCYFPYNYDYYYNEFGYKILSLGNVDCSIIINSFTGLTLLMSDIKCFGIYLIPFLGSPY